MRLPLDIFLALRYLRPKRTFVSVISLLSVLGPMLGVAILIIVSGVMAGFDHDIRNGIMNMSAHLTVYPRNEQGYFTNPDQLLEQLTDEGTAWGVRGTPVIEGTALIQLEGTVYPKLVRGIRPESEDNVTKIQKNFSEEGHLLAEGEAAIGDRLARSLGLRLGDEFLIHSPARLTQNIHWKDDGKVDVREPDELYLPEECRIATFYNMGISDYDDNVVVLHIDQAADLFGLDWGDATSIQVAVDDPMNVASLAALLREKHPECQFVTWQEQNELLFNTLQSEKSLMTFLMAFIILVASFAIAATLITVVVQKTREIGILKAVGVSSWAIARIFLMQGFIIGVIGTVLGTTAGLLILHFRNGIAHLLSAIMGVDVFPPELYHLTSIPALTTPEDLGMAVAMSLAICMAAATIPALYAAAASPAKSLKTENG